MVYAFVSVYKLPSAHQKVHNLLRGRTIFSPVPSSTHSVPEIPSLQCWSVLWWRLDPCCVMRALCIVSWLHVFPPHLNTLVWPLPKVSVTVSYNNYFTRYAVCLNNFWDILHSICNFLHITWHQGIQHITTNYTTYQQVLRNIWHIYTTYDTKVYNIGKLIAQHMGNS